MIPSLTLYFSPCQSLGGEHCNNMQAAYIVNTQARPMYESSTLSILAILRC